jgi:uncharacterized membrane-anchored protein
MKWIIIIVFNILFGLLSGFVTNMVFHSGDGLYSENAIDKKKNTQMILIIAFSAVLSAMALYLVSSRETKWYAAGLLYGIATTMLTPIIIFIVDKSEALRNNPPSGVVLDSKLKFLSELIKSTDFMEAYIVSIFTLLYGIVSLFTPVLGLLWGYIMYKYIMKIE